MQEPQDFRPSTNDSSESERLTLLKSAQTLVTISIIGGPVSLIIGGVLLSTIALICGILAFTKIKRAATPHDTKDALASILRRQAIFAIAIAVFALILNGVTLAMTMPVIFEALQSGNMDELLGSAGLMAGSSASSSSSIWG